MATGTSGAYWAEQALPSKLKHSLLGRYIPQFGGMTGSRDGRVVYLDGYAGEGRYENGDPGSAEIAMQVASRHLSQHGLRWTCFFTEREPKSVARLQEVAETYRKQGVDARVHHGDVDGVLDDVLRTAGGLPLFLFLDPCGLGLPWDRLTQAMTLRRSPSRWPPTEFMLNFSMVAVRRLGGNARSDKGVERSSERFDEVCGGRWWRDFFPSGAAPAPDADEAVAAEYARRLAAATGMLVRSVPVRKAPDHKPVYHLVYGTWRQHGLWVFGDSAARARNEWWEKLEEAEVQSDPNALFPATPLIRPDPQVVHEAAVPAIARNLEGLLARHGRPFKLVDHTVEAFGDYYGQVTELAARAAVKQLHRDGKTPSNGVGRKIRDLVVEPPR